MTRSATLKPLKAESKDAAVILADGTITEHHPGTDFIPLNNNGEASDGTINDENGEHGTEADEENTAEGVASGPDTVAKSDQPASAVGQPTTSKKRTAASEDGPAAKKKRPSSKVTEQIEEQTNAEPGATRPRTPPPKKGRGRPAKNPDTAKTPDGTRNTTGVTSSSGSTQAPGSASTAATSVVSPTSRPAISKQSKRSALAGSVVKGRGIPTSMAEASEADRAMLRMREEGKTWLEINSMWEAMTGEKTGKSTLPNRFARLKANLMSLEEGDADRLLRAKAAVEKRFEVEKWNMIRDAMKEDGSNADYPTAFLQKEYKKLAAAAATAATGEQAMGGANQSTNASAGGNGIKSEDEDGDGEE